MFIIPEFIQETLNQSSEVYDQIISCDTIEESK